MLKVLLKIVFLRYGLFEQSLISLLNFLIIIFYSRFMTIGDFKDFVLIYSAVSLVFIVCSSFFSAPILVFLPTQYKNKSSVYIKYLTKYNVILTFFFSSGVLVFMNLFVLKISLIEGFYSIIFSISWGQYELLRKLNYGRGTVKNLFIGSIVLVLCFSVLNFILKLSIDTQKSFIILSSSYLLAIFVVWLLQLVNSGKDIDSYSLNKKKVRKNHWEFAKWTVIGSILYWACTQGFFILISYFISDGELGGLRTAMNLLGLITIILVLFENTFTPKISTLYKEQGINAVKEYVNNLHSKVTPFFLLTIVVVTMASYYFFEIIFGENFKNYKYLTIIFGIYQFALGLNRPSVVALRALNKTKYFFTGNFIGTVITLLLGLILTINYQEFGSALAIAISGIFVTIYFRNSFSKEVNKNK
ncbi:lipopolysaccharide biosynthesis protein [Bacillus gobiensis]|uniref:Uncharacterized protein n=1 Tax=Bacillus gobiensis TaxID=1441095 RepID=A0A0M4GAP7_9BACI|nr:polysaccharide biosynthesis C-terminal domain-containing protein [Bacillus gobiensis]ALC82640.1 hypothetical protein AM592_14435 [Bacillus gobiensis]